MTKKKHRERVRGGGGRRCRACRDEQLVSWTSGQGRTERVPVDDDRGMGAAPVENVVTGTEWLDDAKPSLSIWEPCRYSCVWAEHIGGGEAVERGLLSSSPAGCGNLGPCCSRAVPVRRWRPVSAAAASALRVGCTAADPRRCSRRRPPAAQRAVGPSVPRQPKFVSRCHSRRGRSPPDPAPAPAAGSPRQCATPATPRRVSVRRRGAPRVATCGCGQSATAGGTAARGVTGPQGSTTPAGPAGQPPSVAQICRRRACIYCPRSQLDFVDQTKHDLHFSLHCLLHMHRVRT